MINKYKFSIILLILLLVLGKVYSQSAYQVELRSGIIFFDCKVAKGDFFESAKGWGSQADVTYFRNFDINRNFSPIIGIGYTNFLYWNVDFFDLLPKVLKPPYSYETYGGDFTSHYLNIKYGLCIDIYKEKLKTNIMGSHYILLHKDLQGFNQNRSFMNVDIGFTYQLNKKYSLSLTTPFSLHPIVQDPVQRVLAPANNPSFERFVEMNGILLGFVYKFNKRRTHEE